jgi:hypothetical protein
MTIRRLILTVGFVAGFTVFGCIRECAKVVAIGAGTVLAVIEGLTLDCENDEESCRIAAALVELLQDDVEEEGDNMVVSVDQPDVPDGTSEEAREQQAIRDLQERMGEVGDKAAPHVDDSRIFPCPDCPNNAPDKKCKLEVTVPEGAEADCSGERCRITIPKDADFKYECSDKCCGSSSSSTPDDNTNSNNFNSSSSEASGDTSSEIYGPPLPPDYNDNTNENVEDSDSSLKPPTPLNPRIEY